MNALPSVSAPQPRHSLARGAVALVSLLVLGACGPSAAPYNDSFSADQIKADLTAIAADSTQGRLVGTPEHDKVGEYIKSRFEAIGVLPAFPGGYEQPFDLEWFSLIEGSQLTVRGVGGVRQPGNGWYPMNVSVLGSGSGPVVFAGFGIVEPRLNWDDYKGADVKGKVVLVLDSEPGVNDAASPFNGLVTATQAREWNKALAAQNHGASAFLIVRDVQNRADIGDWAAASREYWPDQPRRIERFVHPAWAEAITIPAGYISVELAQALVKASGRTLQDLAQAAETASDGMGVVELPGTNVSINVIIERRRTHAMNIVAKVDGSDEDLAGEAVLILAHYDHNGATPDSIYNGADDNASGVAALLALAEAYQKAVADEDGPVRSVVFAATDSEERGPLLGAWHLTMDPPFPLANTVAVFNIDMIGRNEEIPAGGEARFNGLPEQTAESNANALNLIGYSIAPGLAAAVDSANSEELGLTIRRRYDNNASQLLRRSDQWPYLENGVPALWFFTGLHPDYHRVTDDADKINYDKMLRIVRLIHQASWNVANGKGRYTVEAMGTKPAS